MENNKIVVMPVNKAMQRLSSPEWLEAVSKRLLVTASMMSKDLVQEEVEEWKGYLSPYPEAAIDWAFRQYARTEAFFPFPSMILELCDAWEREHDETRSAAYRVRMARERDGKR